MRARLATQPARTALPCCCSSKSTLRRSSILSVQKVPVASVAALQSVSDAEDFDTMFSSCGKAHGEKTYVSLYGPICSKDCPPGIMFLNIFS